ncbi:glutamate--tRNA ligase [Campylobacter canadensis]|uniref:Glutamate--tRNA ligase n=1 Tax=Campylobacter canadensis TaxID=449520 RepID=A0ABS7WP36_9BACT|nr:glutamate--tRNA ligase [Campylobacter canadensis]MBZ7986534.1 glutamate--tRNA ligase [Campylobacter canadensis]
MIKTRFAPSPTGYLHIGGLRTALFSYLYARANNGKFILRIEDTDMARNSAQAAQAILDAFKWVDLEIDSEITYQSKRFDIYKRYIKQLLDEGKAYYCYMSEDELEQLRKEQEAKKLRPKYDGRYRDYKGEIPKDIKPVVRIKAPLSGEIVVNDGVKGKVVFKCEDILDDFVIARADGSPTYNFVVVVDDALMGVSDVIRGDDHLSNTPKQIILYEALNFKIPNFYHLAMINGEDGKKLSKRHGATDVMEYKAMGYLPEALLNFLLRLGYSNKDQEIFSMQEMKECFTFKNVSKGASTYNAKKLEWLNAHYIKSLPDERIINACKELGYDFSSKLKLLHMLKERAKTLVELISSAKIVDNTPQSYDENAINKFVNEISKDLFNKYVNEFTVQENESKYEEFTNEFLQANNAKLKDLAQLLRIALTGVSVSPSVFAMLEYLSEDEIKIRFNNFKGKING